MFDHRCFWRVYKGDGRGAMLYHIQHYDASYFSRLQSHREGHQFDYLYSKFYQTPIQKDENSVQSCISVLDHSGNLQIMSVRKSYKKLLWSTGDSKSTGDDDKLDTTTHVLELSDFGELRILRSKKYKEKGEILFHECCIWSSIPFACDSSCRPRNPVVQWLRQHVVPNLAPHLPPYLFPSQLHPTIAKLIHVTGRAVSTIYQLLKTLHSRALESDSFRQGIHLVQSYFIQFQSALYNFCNDPATSGTVRHTVLRAALLVSNFLLRFFRVLFHILRSSLRDGFGWLWMQWQRQ